MSEGKNVIPVECPYCGQSKMVEDTGDPEQNRQQAADSCFCEGAKQVRRIKQRNEKKKRYLEQRFTNEADREFIARCIDTVDTYNDLKIKATKKNEEEVTI